MSTPLDFDPLEDEQNENVDTHGGEEQEQTSVEQIQEAHRLAQTTQHVVQAASHGIQAFISVLLNPLTWVLMLIFTIILGGYSTIQVIGKNENACAKQESSSDSAGGGDGSSAPTSAEAQAMANKVASWLMKAKFNFLGGKSMSKEMAAAVVGNWMQESTMNPKIVNSIGASGLGQWLGSRKQELNVMAQKMGKPWQDVGVQLAHFQQELDENYGPRLARAGFNSDDKDISKMATQFELIFEGAGAAEANIPKRIANANSFMGYFKETDDIPPLTTSNVHGGSSGGGSGDPAGDQAAEAAIPAACSDGGDYDNSSIVKMAESIAWPKDQRDSSMVHGMANGGKEWATPAYVSAKEAAEKETDKDPQGLYADCGRFVATVMRSTVDKKFPWGPTRSQYQYMKDNADLYEEVGEKKADAHPGDIFIVPGEGGSGHIAIYLGQYDGIDAIADASMQQRTGLIGYANYYKDDMHALDGRQFTIMRYKGPNAGAGDSGTVSDYVVGGKPTYNNKGWPTNIPKVTGTYQGRDIQEYVKKAMEYGNAAIPTSVLCTAGKATLRCDAAKTFNDWNNEYKKTHGGQDLPVNTSYRDMGYQIQLYKQQPQLTAKPGTSNHGWGLAVDIQVGPWDSPLHVWCREHAPKYGWQWPKSVQRGGYGPDEQWHYEFGSVS